MFWTIAKCISLFNDQLTLKRSLEIEQLKTLENKLTTEIKYGLVIQFFIHIEIQFLTKFYRSHRLYLDSYSGHNLRKDSSESCRTFLIGGRHLWIHFGITSNLQTQKKNLREGKTKILTEEGRLSEHYNYLRVALYFNVYFIQVKVKVIQEINQVRVKQWKDT